MSVGIFDAFTVEPIRFTILPQQIVGIVDGVAAFAENGTAIASADDVCCGKSIFCRGNVYGLIWISILSVLPQHFG